MLHLADDPAGIPKPKRSQSNHHDNDTGERGEFIRVVLYAQHLDEIKAVHQKLKPHKFIKTQFCNNPQEILQRGDIDILICPTLNVLERLTRRCQQSDIPPQSLPPVIIYRSTQQRLIGSESVFECISSIEVIHASSSDEFLVKRILNYANQKPLIPASPSSALEKRINELQNKEERLRYLIEHDDLTGLYNRRKLEGLISEASESVKHDNGMFALMYVDLDQFKIVNDSESHKIGDSILLCTALKLKKLLSGEHAVARVNSDEFCILLLNCSETETLALAENIRTMMDEEPFQIKNQTYRISVSIGIAFVTTKHLGKPSEILANADEACFVAKNSGRNTIHVYNRYDRDLQKIKRAVHWVPKIKDALKYDKFKLVYQPIRHLKSDSVSRFEALLRLQGEQGTLITPNFFIPIAESTGLIHDIDLWVVKEAITRLHQGSNQHFSLSVNLSTHAFKNVALVPTVRRYLNKTGIDPTRLSFEITETAAVADRQHSRLIIDQLRGLGCKFALDDFGAGFSSFSYLKHFPVDFLKIDGAFIKDLETDLVDQKLVKSMIDIARSLGKQTVAEFVDTPAALELLTEWGLDFAQGHYIGYPKNWIDA